MNLRHNRIKSSWYVYIAMQCICHPASSFSVPWGLYIMHEIAPEKCPVLVLYLQSRRKLRTFMSNGLVSLEKKRVRGDLITILKSVKGQDREDGLFSACNWEGREHSTSRSRD